MEELHRTLVDIVNSNQGLKVAELALAIPRELLERHGTDAVYEAVMDLENNPEVVCVSYVLPQMSYREKLMFFPKDTEVKLQS